MQLSILPSFYWMFICKDQLIVRQRLSYIFTGIVHQLLIILTYIHVYIYIKLTFGTTRTRRDSCMNGPAQFRICLLIPDDNNADGDYFALKDKDGYSFSCRLVQPRSHLLDQVERGHWVHLQCPHLLLCHIQIDLCSRQQMIQAPSCRSEIIPNIQQRDIPWFRIQMVLSLGCTGPSFNCLSTYVSLQCLGSPAYSVTPIRSTRLGCGQFMSPEGVSGDANFPCQLGETALWGWMNLFHKLIIMVETEKKNVYRQET